MFFMRKPLRFFGHPDVLDIVKTIRLHDNPVAHKENIARIDWIEADAQNTIQLEHGMKLRLFEAQHSYLCYGFVLWRHGQPVFGYSADTGYTKPIYDTITRAPIAVIDGRDKGDQWHASMSEIDAYAQRVPQCAIYVVHYESTEYMFKASNVRLWHEGGVIPLTTAHDNRPELHP